MVEGVLCVLLDDRTLREEREDLEGRAEGVHEDGEEEQRALAEERLRVVLEVEEDRRDDEGHDRVAKHARKEQRPVAAQPLEAARDAQLDLHRDGDGVGGLDALAASLLGAAALAELLE